MADLSKVELLITDWSGVISDDRLPVFETNQRILIHFGLPTMSFEEWLANTRLSVQDFCRAQGVTEEQASDDELYSLYTRHFNEITAAGIVPKVYEDVPMSLNHLTNPKVGVDVVVLSTHIRDNILREARRYKVDRFLTNVVGSVDEKAENIGLIRENFGREPDETIYVGDTVYDIRAGRAAGVIALGVSTGYHLHERLEEEDHDGVYVRFSDLMRAIIKAL